MNPDETIAALHRYLRDDREDAQYDPTTDTIRFAEGDRGFVASATLLRQACEDLARRAFPTRTHARQTA